MDPRDSSEYNPSASSSSADENHPSERKRRRRPTTPPSAPAPASKRQKPAFSQQYLHLLNQDISDVASGLLSESSSTVTTVVPLAELEPTQLGAVYWSVSEKHTFFTALGRLGRDDIDGIASRIGSKSPLEVRQYLHFLDVADRARRASGKRHRGVGPLGIPAAAELSAELTVALDAAADALALRQETYEASLEQKRWGARWLVTKPLAETLETRFRELGRAGSEPISASHQSDLPPFVELFPLRNWLKLSDRVFMNSTVEDGNWRFVSDPEIEADEPPAIRATALADFYSLTLSVTRRLTSAALYVASSRIRAKRAVDPTRHSAVVRKNDVWDAAASVGLKESSREFWARAARRLRLDVLDDRDNFMISGEEGDDDDGEVVDDDEYLSEEGENQGMDVDNASKGDMNEVEEEQSIPSIEQQEDQEDESDHGILSYDAVEAALGFPNPKSSTVNEPPKDSEFALRTGFDTAMDATPTSDSDSDSLSDTPEIDLENQDPDPDPDRPPSPPIDSALLSADLTEALTYSALDYIPTSRSKQALIHRLKAEQRLWADAEALDAATSAAEEARLWGMLRGEPPKLQTESPKPDLGLVWGGSGKRSGQEDQGGNWRDRTEYYSAWELTAEQNRSESRHG
ncbi:hypothetical protein F5B19DRAFT_273785 [Rostrohypoxylon terebratum]|nr:hypothetical protein F5B19DRAFT_273785 [Rostrohypoxylon terebratum]